MFISGVGDALCSFPTVTVLLHDSVSQRASDGSRVLMRGQSYNGDLELLLPLTLRNKNIGMFMVRLGVYTNFFHKKLVLKSFLDFSRFLA